MDNKFLVLFLILLVVLSSGCMDNSGDNKNDPINANEAEEVVKDTNSYQSLAANQEIRLETKEYTLSEISRVKDWNSSSDYDVSSSRMPLKLDEFEEKPSYIVYAYADPEVARFYQIDYEGQVLTDLDYEEIEQRLNEINTRKEENTCEEQLSGVLGSGLRMNDFSAADQQLQIFVQNTGTQEAYLKNIRLEDKNSDKVAEKGLDETVNVGEETTIELDQVSSSDNCNEYNLEFTFDSGGIKGQVVEGSLSGYFE